MRKICIINQKGGVAKTTSAITIAHGLASAGKKVLLVDVDPQGNITSSLPVDKTRKGLYDVLIENANPQECIQRVSDHIDVLPSKETLTKAEFIMVGERAREHILIRKFRKIKGYDYILFDCAPSLGLLNQNVMLYCEEAWIPVSCDYLGIDAMKKMVSAINSINDVFEHGLEVTKVIPTMYDSRLKVCKESLVTLQNDFYEKVTSPIRLNSKLKEAPKFKKDIFSFAKSSNGAKDYAAVISLILQDETQFNAQDFEQESVGTPA